MKTMRSVLLDILVAALMLAAFLVPLVPFYASAQTPPIMEMRINPDISGGYYLETLFDFTGLQSFGDLADVYLNGVQQSFQYQWEENPGDYFGNFTNPAQPMAQPPEENAVFTIEMVFLDNTYSQTFYYYDGNFNLTPNGVVEMPNFLGSTTPGSIIASVRQGTQETSDQLPFALAGTGIAFSIGGGLLWFLARSIK